MRGTIGPLAGRQETNDFLGVKQPSGRREKPMKYGVAPWCMVALTLPGMIDGEDRPGSWRVDLTPCRVTVDPGPKTTWRSAQSAVLNEADKEVLIVLMAHTRGRGVACLKVKFRDEDLTAPDGLRFPTRWPESVHHALREYRGVEEGARGSIAVAGVS